ncbi:serine protease inhibitor ecotin [Dysgonomonas sp. OttesenSCG-928-M03]|nr:serine protease inhibitor ecotin [Dysgonomonas sp. OttesenSCG-928-M03]
MKRITKITTALLTLSLFMSLTIFAGAQDKKSMDEMLKPFPQAEAGMVRHVIELPKKSNEDAFKVEIVPGKTMSVDCNNHRLAGTLTEKDLEGWGYNYYVFNSDGQTMSTMMACNQPKKIKFVTGQTLIVRYNSKLPIVIYAPAGFDVKYRIWKAGKDQNSKVK